MAFGRRGVVEVTIVKENEEDKVVVVDVVFVVVSSSSSGRGSCSKFLGYSNKSNISGSDNQFSSCSGSG